MSNILSSEYEAPVCGNIGVPPTSLIEKNPDYSYMRNGKNMYEAWDDYIRETISATPYFYPESEATTVFKDSLIKDEFEVMPWLDNKSKIKKI